MRFAKINFVDLYILIVIVAIGAFFLKFTGVLSEPTIPKLTTAFREMKHDKNEYGVQISYEITITNKANRSIDIIGSDATCGPKGCWKVSPLPMTLQPDMTQVLNAVYHSPSFEPELCNLQLYVDNGIGRMVEVAIEPQMGRLPYK